MGVGRGGMEEGDGDGSGEGGEGWRREMRMGGGRGGIEEGGGDGRGEGRGWRILFQDSTCPSPCETLRGRLSSLVPWELGSGSHHPGGTRW